MHVQSILIESEKVSKIFRLKTIFCLYAAFFLAGCSANDDKNQNLVTAVDSSKQIIPKESTNYKEFDYKLPQSSYNVKIKITGVSTKIAKNAFVTQVDQYAVSQKADGYFLTLSFSVTSPYDHELMVPVPDYFYITSENGEWFSASTTRHKQCHCEIDNSAEVLTLKGKRLYEISEGKCGYDNYCVKFKAKESKEFKIKFTDAILGSVRKLAFNGFNMSWNNPDYTVEQDKGLIIDVDAGKIVGEKLF